MAYDEHLAERIRALLATEPGLTARQMFGGIGFMLNGNMCCGVHGEDMIVRLSAEAAADALTRPHARPFDMTGRPMRGWLLVGPGATGAEESLAAWVAESAAFAASLPPK